MQFSANSLPNNRLAPLAIGLAPHVGNPAAATGQTYLLCWEKIMQQLHSSQHENKTKLRSQDLFTLSISINLQCHWLNLLSLLISQGNRSKCKQTFRTVKIEACATDRFLVSDFVLFWWTGLVLNAAFIALRLPYSLSLYWYLTTDISWHGSNGHFFNPGWSCTTILSGVQPVLELPLLG